MQYWPYSAFGLFSRHRVRKALKRQNAVLFRIPSLRSGGALLCGERPRGSSGRSVCRLAGGAGSACVRPWRTAHRRRRCTPPRSAAAPYTGAAAATNPPPTRESRRFGPAPSGARAKGVPLFRLPWTRMAALASDTLQCAAPDRTSVIE